MREDRAALDRLRLEIETLKKSASSANIENIPQSRAPVANKPLTASEWKHAGRSTPEHALETLLWAGLNRNLDVLTASLAIEPGAAQEKAEALLASLPDEARGYYGTPERFIAHLTAAQLGYEAMAVDQTLPLGEEVVQIVHQHQPEISAMTLVTVDLHRKEGLPKRKTLIMQRSFDGWKFAVPESAVDTYAAQLANGGMPSP